MSEKNILDLNLNYGHKNLSVSFRWTSATVGVLMIVIGIIGIVQHSLQQFWFGLSCLINLVFGMFMLIASSKRLLIFFRKYFLITETEVKYKSTFIFPGRKFKWDKVEAVELSSNLLRVRLEDENNPRNISLLSVSYQDYELLQKTIVEICMEKDIDLL